MSLFYISLWLTLKKTSVILQDAVLLTLSIQLQNYKNYTARLETLGQAINCPHHFWKNLFVWAIYCPYKRDNKFPIQNMPTRNIHWKACNLSGLKGIILHEIVSLNWNILPIWITPYQLPSNTTEIKITLFQYFKTLKRSNQ